MSTRSSALAMMIAVSAAVLAASGCAGTSSFSPPSRAGAQNATIRQSNTPLTDACSTKACIYVTDRSVAAITVYTKGAHGDAAPIRTITGAMTGLNGPVGMSLDASRAVYVANYSGTSVTVYAPGANGNVAPTRTIAGSKTLLSGPDFVALDSSGKSYVVNWGGGSIDVFAAGANGNVAPTATIAGSNTTLASRSPWSSTPARR